MSNTIIDNRTPNLDLPLPHGDTPLHEDIPRIISCFEKLDANAKEQKDKLAEQGDNQAQALGNHNQDAKAHANLETPDATETVKGKAQFASLEESKKGKIKNKSMSPYSVAQLIAGIPTIPDATESVAGKAQFATESEVLAGKLVDRIVGPKYLLAAIEEYLNSLKLIGDIDFFNRQTPPENYAVGNGALLANVDTTYPFLLSELQKPENSWRLKTELEYQALIHEDGIGGANAWVIDLDANTIRVPDIRGDYMAGAGWNGKAVGDSDGDTIRNMDGSVGTADTSDFGLFRGPSGVFSATLMSRRSQVFANNSTVMGNNLIFNASSIVPTDIRNHPATIYMLPCIYIGKNTTTPAIV